MANSRGPSTTRNTIYNGKHSLLLPPKYPFPSISPSYSDYISTSTITPKGIHQRASSESLVIEEQPSWLDDLLNEPETPVQRGHRRSSSDSFTYLEAANAVKNEQRMRNIQDFSYKDPNVLINNRSWGWDSVQNGELGLRRTVSLGATQELNGMRDVGDSGPRQDANSSSETDTKRAKQQFAQRSRVRKLQYIAELERNVQALQAEGGEVSAELEFLNQQSLILGMENKALKQRLENLAQEQLIKCLEHEVLEREIGRLRALYQQQQQSQPPPQQPPQSHRRTASRDRLDFQFSNLSLKNTESSSLRDPVSSQPRT